MRIAQVAPLYESVPPKLYGGTERIVSFLTEKLVELGHNVTLFASGDSITSAKLRPVVPEALRLSGRCEDPLAPHLLQVQEVVDRHQEFDIIHFHTDYLNFPFTQHLETPHVTTLHGKLTLPELVQVYRRFSRQPVVSISDSQRTPLPFANWAGTVLHGLPADLYSKGPGGEYLAFLGRISPEKGIEAAIAIAKKSGIQLKIAAKIDRVDEDYFSHTVAPLLDHPLVDFIGEITDEQKNEFLGNALALLFPIAWPEPFGLVMIESIACGTPVIAFRRGSVPEIISHGKSGYVVDSVEQAVQAVHWTQRLDRDGVRRCFNERFTSDRMARQYIQVYEELRQDAADRRETKLLTLKSMYASPNTVTAARG
ncbi:MAG TPA: glycosyltransferase family 4 protein [Flavisolibacter sp.]